MIFNINSTRGHTGSLLVHTIRAAVLQIIIQFKIETQQSGSCVSKKKKASMHRMKLKGNAL